LPPEPGFAMFDSMAKMLITFGIVAVVAGLLLLGAGRIFPLGRLPGDIFFHRGNFTFYFPLVTSIVLSILLTIILNLISRR